MPATVIANSSAPRMKRSRRPVKPPQPERRARRAVGKPWQSVRKGKVARARKLLADPNYPPPNVLNSVARLLARHLRPDN